MNNEHFLQVLSVSLSQYIKHARNKHKLRSLEKSVSTDLVQASDAVGNTITWLIRNFADKKLKKGNDGSKDLLAKRMCICLMSHLFLESASLRKSHLIIKFTHAKHHNVHHVLCTPSIFEGLQEHIAHTSTRSWRYIWSTAHTQNELWKICRG